MKSVDDKSVTIERIPPGEVTFHPHSFTNHNGARLFLWDGGIYRGILPQSAPYFIQLFQDGIIQRAAERGLLIETDLTPLTLDGYGLVLRHRRIPFVSYPNEWCALMLKDAALTLLDLAIELAPYGFTLADAHPWNLLFDDCHPVFVDLGSIIHIDNPVWPAYDEFCRFCLYPLMLMSKGQELIARLLMCEDKGVPHSDLLLLTQCSALISNPKASLLSRLIAVLRKQVPQAYREQIKYLLRASPMGVDKPSGKHKSAAGLTKAITHSSHIEFLKGVKREVEAISFSSGITESPDHKESSPSPITEPDAWTLKQREIHQILRSLRPSTVLVIGSHTGWYCKLAARQGSRVVSFDTDSASVTRLYYEAREQKLPVLPLLMDFSKPTPARGLASHWAIAATERLRCEMVLALEWLPDLICERHLRFEQIAEGVALFAKRWAMVEFVGKENAKVSRCWTEVFSWYKLENLVQALEKKFSSVRVVASEPDGRAWLLCEK